MHTEPIIVCCFLCHRFAYSDAAKQQQKQRTLNSTQNSALAPSHNHQVPAVTATSPDRASQHQNQHQQQQSPNAVSPKRLQIQPNSVSNEPLDSKGLTHASAADQEQTDARNGHDTAGFPA